MDAFTLKDTQFLYFHKISINKPSPKINPKYILLQTYSSFDKDKIVDILKLTYV